MIMAIIGIILCILITIRIYQGIQTNDKLGTIKRRLTEIRDE